MSTKLTTKEEEILADLQRRSARAREKFALVGSLSGAAKPSRFNDTAIGIDEHGSPLAENPASFSHTRRRRSGLTLVQTRALAKKSCK